MRARVGARCAAQWCPDASRAPSLEAMKKPVWRPVRLLPRCLGGVGEVVSLATPQSWPKKRKKCSTVSLRSCRRGRDGASCVGAIDGVTTVRKEVEARSDLRCCEAKAATCGRPRRGCDESRSARSTGL